MSLLEKHLSPYVAAQLPRLYQEEGAGFIAFIKAYYEWMELDGNVMDMAKSLPEYRDIDTTLDKFIVHFQEKYMKGVPVDAIGDARLLQKHIKELYSTKGTPEGLQLLFRLLYNENVDIYYPGNDVLKASDGKWMQPIYIEVSANPKNVLLIGSLVVGRESRASAIVEDFQIRYVNKKQINILYLSNKIGEFKTGELVLSNVISDPLQSPTIIGSMNDVYINESGFGFVVGDQLDIVGGSGVDGKVVVSETISRNGSVAFNIKNGGTGYANDNIWAPTTVDIVAVSNTNPGIGANFKIGDITNTKIITTPVDILGDYANVAWDSADYGFHSTVVTNINTVLSLALNVQDIIVGTITTLVSINPGAGYNGPININVHNDVIGGLEIRDNPNTDEFEGLNAVITGLATAGEGAIAQVNILNSGFGYQEGDVVTFENANVPYVAGGSVILGHSGRGVGHWKDSRSFLNSDKYITDSNYYQDFSYEVQAAISFARYSDLLKNIWHPAGMAKFGRVVVINENDTGSSIAEVQINALFETTFMHDFAHNVQTSFVTSTLFNTNVPTTIATDVQTETTRETATQVLATLPEQLVNSTFPASLSNWSTASGNVLWNATGSMQLGNTSSTGASYQGFATNPGSTYWASMTVAQYSGANVSLSVSNTSSGGALASYSSANTQQFGFSFIANSPTMYVIVSTDAAGSSYSLVDNISIKELPIKTVNTVFNTSTPTNTSYATSRITSRMTSSVYDSTFSTNFNTTAFTQSAYATDRITNRNTNTLFSTAFNTSLLTSRPTDTTVVVGNETSRATSSSISTNFATAAITSRLTNTTIVTSYGTTNTTATVYSSAYAVYRNTSRTVQTAASTSRNSSRATTTSYASGYTTIYLTSTNASRATATARATATTTLYQTSYNSAFTTVFATSTSASRTTSYVAGQSRSTDTQRNTTANVVTSYATQTQRTTSVSTARATIVCVTADSFLTTGIRAKDAKPGMMFTTWTPTEKLQEHKISSVGEPALTRSVKITTAAGAVLTCSTTTPFNLKTSTTDLEDGHWKFAPDMLGEYVLVSHSSEATNVRDVEWELVVSVEDNGMKLVVPISFDGRSFLAGSDANHRIFSHNMAKPGGMSTFTVFDSSYVTYFNTDTSVITAANTMTTFATTTLFDVATSKTTNYVSSFNTSRATSVATSNITSKATNTYTTFNTTTTYVTSKNTSNPTSVNTSRQTSTIEQVAYVTTFATTTTYSTASMTSVITTKATSTLYDTTRTTIAPTSTLFTTLYDTVFDTSVIKTTTYITGRTTSYATTTGFMTNYDTSVVTQRVTATLFNTNYDTNTLKLTAKSTDRTTSTSTSVSTNTLYSTIFDTVIITNSNFNTSSITTFVVIPTPFNTAYLTTTTRDTDHATTTETSKNTDTLYDTEYPTSRLTSIATETSLLPI